MKTRFGNQMKWEQFVCMNYIVKYSESVTICMLLLLIAAQEEEKVVYNSTCSQSPYLNKIFAIPFQMLHFSNRKIEMELRKKVEERTE